VKDCAINVHFLRLSGAPVKIAAARGLIGPEFETFDWRHPRRFLFVVGGKKPFAFLPSTIKVRARVRTFLRPERDPSLLGIYNGAPVC
jgi:hypothetical protein